MISLAFFGKVMTNTSPFAAYPCSCLISTDKDKCEPSSCLKPPYSFTPVSPLLITQKDQQCGNGEMPVQF